MKRSKKLYILLGVLAVAIAATVLVTKLQEKQEEIQTTAETILQIAPDDVTALSWENETSALALHTEDGAWVYDDDAEFPVSADAVNRLLSVFEDFGASFIIENVTDYGQYGLDDPVCTIDLTAGEDSYEITLGDFSSMDSQRYVSIGDGNVYLVATDPLESFSVTLSDLIANDETPSFGSISSITFAGGEDYTIAYDESGGSVCADDVYYAQLDGQSLPLDTDRVESYAAAISALDLTDYVTYKATDETLAAYGLDSPELTVTVSYANEDDDGNSVPGTLTLAVGRNPDEVAAAAADADGETEVSAYLRIGDSRIVYRLTADQYESLMAAGYNDLRHRELMTVDFDSVRQIDVSLEGESYTLTAAASEDDEDETVWSYGDVEVDITNLRSKLTALAASGADRFVTESPTAKEEISLTLYLNDESHPQLTIALYRYDGESCLAVVDGASVALIERAQAVDLIEAVNAIVLAQ